MRSFNKYNVELEWIQVEYHKNVFILSMDGKLTRITSRFFRNGEKKKKEAELLASAKGRWKTSSITCITRRNYAMLIFIDDCSFFYSFVFHSTSTFNS